MAFCENCGNQLSENARFCATCGKPINITTNNTKKREFTDGEIHKCPYCGEPIPAFALKCTHCGKELRGVKASSALKDLVEKIEQAQTEQQRILIIKNFPIPNTKEDIVEFMLLAMSNFDATYYATHLNVEDISDAWLTKVEQCYQKAKFLCEEKDLNKIEKIYIEIKEKIQKVIKSEKRLKLKKATTSLIKDILSNGIQLFIYIMPVLFIVGGILLFFITPGLDEEIGSIIGLSSMTIIIVGIVVLRKRKKSNKEIYYYEESATKYSTKTGFSSWSTLGKVMWIILNIYLVGIPAIIYVCCKKN